MEHIGKKLSAPVAVVTGASAGVGRAVARELARRGFRVGLLARGTDGLLAAAREVRELGSEALVQICDVSDPAAVEHAAGEVEYTLGPIDVWVNNAMASVFAPCWQTEPDEYKRVTEVTYLGSVYGVQAALRRMRPRDRGVIVQVGSSLSYRGIPLQSAYCAAKHAIKGFLDSVRSELAHEGSAIRVVNVHLPAVNTPQFEWTRSRLPRRLQPVGPIFQPEIAARSIVHAALHPRREMWVGTSTATVIVGSFLFPAILDRYLAEAAWDGQMTDEPAWSRPDNLVLPLPGDYGAHGRFDARATKISPAAWAGRHRGLVMAAVALPIALWALAAWRSSKRAPPE
jgi:NAD(P)-dependent dehydrogenase (short-subunit alcohol dehydrogenase family)